MKLQEFSQTLAFTIVITIGSLLMLSSVFYIFGFPLSLLNIIISIIGGLLFGWLMIKELLKKELLKKNFTYFLILSVSLLTIFIGTILISRQNFDLSADGQTYHQEAVIQLASGWNPYYSGVSSAAPAAIWIEHYSKGPWIYEAALYKLTNRIEDAKAFNFILICAVFLLSFSFFKKFNLPHSTALLLGLLVSSNPVSVNQSLSFYVDGQAASLLTLLLLLLYFSYEKLDLFTALALLSCLILVVNVKFTALVYAFIFCGGFILFRLSDRRNAYRNIAVIVAGCLIGLLLIGYNPYVTNTLEHGHPFYPVYGSKIDVIADTAGADFSQLNRFQKLFLSLMSKSSNTYHFDIPALKIPFTVEKSELNAFVNTDTRVGGFGPLFGGLLILSGVILVFSLKLEKTLLKYIFPAIGLIIMSVVFNPECWWARYVPQLWLVPLIAVFLALRPANVKLLKYAGMAGIILLLMNVIITTTPYLAKQYVYNGILSRQLHYLAENSRGNTVMVSFNGFDSNRIRLKEAGVNFEEVRDLPESGARLVSSNTQIYISDPNILKQLVNLKELTNQIKLKRLNQ